MYLQVVISFNIQELEDLCYDEQKAFAYYNSDVATELLARIADIDAAKNLGDLPEILWNKPIQTKSGLLVASFPIGSNGLNLFFTQNHIPSRQKHIKEDWLTVSRIRVLTISNNYHDNI